MTNGTTNPLLTNPQLTSAASFLSVLTGTVGLPVQGAGANDSHPDEQNGSDSADSQQSERNNPQAGSAGQTQGLTMATPFSDAGGANLTILPVARFQKTLSTTNSAALATTVATKGSKIEAGAPQKNASSVADSAAPVPVTVPVQVRPVEVPSTTTAGEAGTASAPAASGVTETPALDLTATSDLGQAATIQSAQTSQTEAGTTTRQETAASAEITVPAAAIAQTGQTSNTQSAPVADPTQSGGQPLVRTAQTQTQNSLPSDPAADTDGPNNVVPAATQTPAHQGASPVLYPLPVDVAKLIATEKSPATPSGSSKGSANDTQTASPSAGNASSNGTGSAQNSTIAVAPATPALFMAGSFLPNLSVVNPASTVQPVAKASESAVSASSSVNGSGNGGSSSSATKAEQNSSATPSTAPGQNAQNFTTQSHAQTDVAQTGAVLAKAVEIPLQTVPVHTSAAQPAVSAPAEKQHPGDVAGTALPASGDSGETIGSSGINTAKLIQTLSETQMHVGMRSAEFGDISIRTAVTQQQMVVQITVDHGDLSRAIAQSAPAAQTRLGDDLGLRAAIEVTQSGAGFSNHNGNASQQEQRSFVRPVEAVAAVSLAETESIAPRMAVEAEDADRLDIRA